MLIMLCPVSLLSRSARLPLHPRGDLYVHGETAPVHLFGRDVGETALRHPLPRGPTQWLRLDNKTFNMHTCPSLNHLPPFTCKLQDLPLRRSLFCSNNPIDLTFSCC